MHIHEYQAKELLQNWIRSQKVDLDIETTVSPFVIVSCKEEIPRAIQQLSLTQGVVKAQIHAGGRGKSGGIRAGKNPRELIEAAKEILGKNIVNEQTGHQGICVQKVMFTQLISIKKEYYLAITIDRKCRSLVLIASRKGGVDIESLAERDPKSIVHQQIALSSRLQNEQVDELIEFFGWKGRCAKRAEILLQTLIHLFIERDATLLEINPLVLTPQNELSILDIKITIDEQALFRQKEMAAYEDLSQLPPLEQYAHRLGLSYIAMSGNIGCIVNGAGLAMATMDMIHSLGQNPANFLDIGGGATKERICQGFSLVASDPKVKVIFVNIFGGIMSCRIVAEGVIAALEEIYSDPDFSLKKTLSTLVVRMEGLEKNEGKRTLQKASLESKYRGKIRIIVARELSEAMSAILSST